MTVKELKVSFFISFALVVALSIFSLVAEARNITQNVFRLHVRAADNSAYAQKIKIDVRDAVLGCTSEITKNCKDAKDAKKAISENIEKIENSANDVLDKNNCEYDAKAYIAKENFPTRTYEDISLPAGEYEALVIELGDAKGENWWCMLYPRLCAGKADDGDIRDALGGKTAKVLSDKDCYKFKILEIIGTVF